MESFVSQAKKCLPEDAFGKCICAICSFDGAAVAFSKNKYNDKKIEASWESRFDSIFLELNTKKVSGLENLGLNFQKIKRSREVIDNPNLICDFCLVKFLENEDILIESQRTNGDYITFEEFKKEVKFSVEDIVEEHKKWEAHNSRRTL